MERLVKEFLCYLENERSRSVHTVGSYGADLESFCKYVRSLDPNVGWDAVDACVVHGWMERMSDKGNEATSINRRLCSLRAFFRYAVRSGKLHHNPVRLVSGPKKKKPLPQYLTESEMGRLLDEERWGDDFGDVRSRTIILVFYSTGIRLSELQCLDDESVDNVHNQLRVVGKRKKERLVPFGVELESALAYYKSKRDEMFRMGNGPLFVDDKGCRMTPQQIRDDVKRSISKVSSMKKRSPHVLRHTFATAMLNNGSNIEHVQKFLGHESVSTTEIYTHTTFGQLRRVYSEAHPRGADSKGSPLND